MFECIMWWVRPLALGFVLAGAYMWVTDHRVTWSGYVWIDPKPAPVIIAPPPFDWLPVKTAEEYRI